ncbi:MAG: hypothetical protein JJE48_01275 [Actinobacteria bacterium]|nr:hypothetical protein [Actinomycetota bacterium]
MSLREKMRPGEWVAIVSSSILLFSVFLRWFNCSFSDMSTGRTINITVSGWEETKLSTFVIVFALLVISLTIFAKARPDLMPEKLPDQLIVAALGFGALVIVIVKIFVHDDDLGISYGIFISLASSIAVVVGGFILGMERANRKQDDPFG